MAAVGGQAGGTEDAGKGQAADRDALCLVQQTFHGDTEAVRAALRVSFPTWPLSLPSSARVT